MSPSPQPPTAQPAPLQLYPGAFKRAVIDLPGAGQVHLRSPSARAYAAIKELHARKAKGEDVEIAALELTIRASVCTPEGVLQFKDPEVDPLDTFTIHQANEIAIKSMELLAGKTWNQIVAETDTPADPAESAAGNS